jgi:GT2 family glycosyltransferase
MGLVPYPALERPEHPVVSVCIANYNGESLLDDCIASVLAQDADESIEIIVHDDASTDSSVQLLRSRYTHVDVLASTENVGFCISNNRMVAHARGEYVLLLNNDAALYPDAIRTLLTAVRAGDSGILTLPQYDWNTGVLVDRGCLLDPFYNPVPNLDPDRPDVAYVIGACLWIPRALWSELGGFPEWMESIGEDIFLCCWARLRGIPVRAISNSGYRHRQGVHFGGNRVSRGKLVTTSRRRRLSERNKTFAMVIFSQHALLAGLLPLHLFLLGAESMVVGLVRRDWWLVRDIYGAVAASLWCERLHLLQVRAEIQRSRRISWREFYRSFTALPRKLLLLLRHGVPTIDR